MNHKHPVDDRNTPVDTAAVATEADQVATRGSLAWAAAFGAIAEMHRAAAPRAAVTAGRPGARGDIARRYMALLAEAHGEALAPEETAPRPVPGVHCRFLLTTAATLAPMFGAGAPPALLAELRLPAAPAVDEVVDLDGARYRVVRRAWEVVTAAANPALADAPAATCVLRVVGAPAER